MRRGRSWRAISTYLRSKRHYAVAGSARVAIVLTREPCGFQVLEGVTHNDPVVATRLSDRSDALLSSCTRASSRKRPSSRTGSGRIGSPSRSDSSAGVGVSAGAATCAAGRESVLRLRRAAEFVGARKA